MRRRVLRCVAAAAVLLSLAGCGGAERKARADSPSHPKPPRPPLVMFLGDSYTVGRLGQVPEHSYAAETARLLDWQVIIGGFRGTGFVSRGHVGKNFAGLFEEQLGWRPAPDMLIISGGHNDRRYTPDLVAGAARRLITRVRQRWPKSKLLIIGPMWGGDPVSSVTAVRDALAAVADQAGVPFVDPLGEQWITGNRRRGTGNAPGYILSDGIHPTPDGARHIAERLTADLRRLQLTKP